MNKTKNRVGEKHTMKNGAELVIIEYFNAKNVTVKFNDNIVLKNVHYDNVRFGKLVNKNVKSVYGIGFVGYGNYECSSHRSLYKIWHGMLQRCYSESSQLKHPTYRDVFVCDDWHNFQNFAKWCDKNYIKGYDLDKDILFKGCKIYSLDTCSFVPREINSLILKSDNARGLYPIGVSKKGNLFRAAISINKFKKAIGLYNTPKEAFAAYKEAKEQQIKIVALKNFQSDKINKMVFDALNNYQVEITD